MKRKTFKKHLGLIIAVMVFGNSYGDIVKSQQEHNGLAQKDISRNPLNEKSLDSGSSKIRGLESEGIINHLPNHANSPIVKFSSGRSRNYYDVEGYSNNHFVQGEIEINRSDGKINGYIFGSNQDKTYIYGELNKYQDVVAYDKEGNVYQLIIIESTRR
ncbi:MAG: hypothetical protein ACE5EH_02115 [Gammaproteobacteria bacterium]